MRARERNSQPGVVGLFDRLLLLLEFIKLLLGFLYLRFSFQPLELGFPSSESSVSKPLDRYDPLRRRKRPKREVLVGAVRGDDDVRGSFDEVGRWERAASGGSMSLIRE